MTVCRVVAVNILLDRKYVRCNWQQKKATQTFVVFQKETPLALRLPGRPIRVGHSSRSSRLYARVDIPRLREFLWYSDIQMRGQNEFQSTHRKASCSIGLKNPVSANMR